MKNNILYLVVALIAPFAVHTVSAQNLDPTVEVNRDYEGKLLIVHKPILDMAVPDSVYRFDLDFDYSVTDTPYKGAYEFVPYSLDINLAPKHRDRGKLYLKAGAGYQLHPVFDLVWTPVFKNDFRLDMYGRNRSYLGNYWTMSSPDFTTEEIGIVDGDPGKEAWSGMDLSTSAGVAGRYDWKNAMMVFGADYVNLLQSQKMDVYGLRVRSYNSAGLNLGVAAKDPHSVGLDYKVGLEYRYSDDLANDQVNGLAGLQSHDLDFGLNVESVLTGGHNMKIDARFGMTDESGFFDVTAGAFEFAPRYVLKASRWHLDLGLRLSTVFKTDGKSSVFQYKEQVIYPDLRAEYMISPEFLKVYASLGGGCEMNTYSSLVNDNRRLNFYYGRGVWNILDVTEEKLAAELGFEGRITHRFGYTLKGGYKVYGNAPLQALYIPTGVSEYLPALGYAPYQMAYASMDFLFDSEPLRVDGNLEFNGVTSIVESFSTLAGFVFPAPFKGDVEVMYDFKDRIFAGVDCEFSTSRDGRAYRQTKVGSAKDYKVTVPGYADLGVSLEYRCNNKMSFWARGGNLLGMTIQRELLYAEKGPYFTAGICLNL